MIVRGTGSNGFAVIIARESEGDAYKQDLWLDQPLFRFAVRDSAERRNTLRVALRPHRRPGKLTADELHALRPELEALLRERRIRVVASVGREPFSLLARRTGAEERWAGSIITREDGLRVIPVVPPWMYDNPFLRRLQAEYLRRAYQLARGTIRQHVWQTLHVQPNEEMLAALLRIQARGLPVGTDIETAGTDVLQVPITSMGVADEHDACACPWEDYDARSYGPIAGIRGYGALGAEIERVYLEILRGPQTKILHNGGYDILGLRKRGIELGGEIEDTLLLHRVLYPERKHNLQDTAVGELPVEPWKADFKTDVGDFVENDATKMRVYNAKDCGCEPVVFKSMLAKLDCIHRGHELYAQYKALARVAAKMQEVGIRADRAEVDRLTKSTQDELARLRGEWEELAPGVALGKTGATPAVREFFISTLGAPIVARTKKGAASVPSAALLEYRELGNETLARAATTCFYYRKNAKLLTAFLERLAGQERIHATFKVWGTKGARWSSSNPNLMQISKEAKDEKTGRLITPNIRGVFTADPGFVLIEADYSQLELREVAYFAGMEEVLYWLDMERKEPGKWDPHVLHARQMFGRNDIDKKHKLRVITKTLTYALFYNYYRGVKKVYQALKPKFPDLTLKMLEDIQKRFYKARPELPRWQESIAQFVRQHGYVEAPLSGRRLLQDRANPDLNACLSFPIQSTGGDVANPATLEVDRQLDWEVGEHIKLQVHDALVVQCRPQHAARVGGLMRTAMERPVQINGQTVSFPVDIQTGPSWLDMKHLAA